MYICTVVRVVGVVGGGQSRLSALSAFSVRGMRPVWMRKGKTTEVEAGGCARRGVERSSCSSLCA